MNAGRSYLWAELGALGGAAVAGVPALIIAVAALSPFVFSDVGDWYFITVSTITFGLTIAGSAWGCRFALRRRGFQGGNRTAVVLATLLSALYLTGVISSGTELQSDLFPPLSAAALLMPPLARGIAVRF